MKTLSFRHLTFFLAACMLALTSCGVPYDHRSYVRGTGYGIDPEPIPSHVTVVDSDGNSITSGYSNRDAFYHNRRYYGNRYYGGMFYGYNNPPVSYVPASGSAYLYRPINAWSY
ncbi:MAG: hypothetical protein ACO1TE_07805 [Prosthecobacter sp.]